jgi:pimeloyl-ACP methyl ester carboxylesterase
VPARLHHERIVRTGTTPERWLLITHGIYGAGSNWRGIARKLNDRRPEWGIELVDLRQHGRSEPSEPPHTLAACADDLRALIAELDVRVDALAGHSFGGKVALVTRALVSLPQTWVLDASPSPRSGALDDRGNSVVRVLELMERLPKTWTRREDFVAAVMADGHDIGLAQWLAMNVVADPSGTLTLRLDLAALREMLADYYARDLWDTLSSGNGDVTFVIADRATTVSAADRARLDRFEAGRAPYVHVHHVDAGHWLHIEAPAAVIELFATHLP